MRRTGKKAAALAVTAALAVSAAGCGSVKDSDVVVTIGGEKVTVGVANFFARYQQAEYETYYSGVMGEDMWSTEISKGKSYEETVKNQILETLENMYVLEDHRKRRRSARQQKRLMRQTDWKKRKLFPEQQKM